MVVFFASMCSIVVSVGIELMHYIQPTTCHGNVEEGFNFQPQDNYLCSPMTSV
jgi:hypothetical protein